MAKYYTLAAFQYSGDKPRVNIYVGNFEENRDVLPPCMTGHLEILVNSYKEARQFALKAFPKHTTTNGVIG